jgi:heme-degrading monooxygenase HmoA
MFVILIHWRIKEGEDEAFIKHWKTENSIADTAHLVHEFLSKSIPSSEMSYTTWHLDESSLGDHTSYVTVGIWDDGEAFQNQIAKYFNDMKPLLPFEKYRRRRVAFNPVAWRIGNAVAPETSSDEVN